MASDGSIDTQKQRRTVAIGSIAAAAGLILITYQLWPAAAATMSGQSFYTDDGGKTWYRDSAFQVPPFTHAGATAVRALVFRSTRGEFVRLLQRYNTSAKKVLDEAIVQYQAGKKSRGEIEVLLGSDQIRGGTEAALPGDHPKWVPASALPADAVKSPDQSPAVFVAP